VDDRDVGDVRVPHRGQRVTEHDGEEVFVRQDRFEVDSPVLIDRLGRFRCGTADPDRVEMTDRGDGVLDTHDR
jgi:hypothetical protein